LYLGSLFPVPDRNKTMHMQWKLHVQLSFILKICTCNIKNFRERERREGRPW